jgi:twitching motility protein PilT
MVRVDGGLRPLGSAPVERVASILDALPADRLAAASSGESAFDATFDHEDRRVRIHVYRAAEGTAAAIRILPGLAPALAALHLPVDVGDLALAPSGLVIVCGPTGSGKSSTLAALAQEVVRRRAALLVTLEDPIEYRITPAASGGGIVRQRQIGRDVASFAAGLRDALREDPDAILVGEMRDPESVALALTAAETGHLVLASLHSRSASSAIERIVDASAGRRESEVRAQVAQSLRAVIAQRLVPRERGGGRAVAVEVLRANHNVAGLIREGKTAQLPSAIQSSRKEGMLLLEASLAELVRSGAVARESAAAVANEPAILAAHLDRA